MHEAALLEALPDLLATQWGLRDAHVAAAAGPRGMGSVVAAVEVPGAGPFVAKWVVGSAAEALDRGSAVALELERAGLSTGAPLPTRHGALSAPASGGRVALLRRVAGHPLTGTSAEDQQRIARVLARVHAARTPRSCAESYLDDSLAQAVDVEAWVVPAVNAVRAEYARLPPLTWGLVHHDPAPEAFFHDDRTGETAVIDWTGAGEGPVGYDVASALMYLGGEAAGRMFLDAYRRLVPAPLAAETTACLQPLRRFRGAVQAAYFSRRVARGDLTGVGSQADNLVGLHDARRMLVGLGLSEASHRPGTGDRVLRPMRLDDLDAVGTVQEEGSVAALAHVFPQDTSPFPRAALRQRWEQEVAEPATDCFVITGPSGEVAGFAATRHAELLHFGTALDTWGSGLARRAHDELVEHLRACGATRARLWVFEANHHARHFYEHRGWRPTGARTTSGFAPNPVLLAYERSLLPTLTDS